MDSSQYKRRRTTQTRPKTNIPARRESSWLLSTRPDIIPAYAVTAKPKPTKSLDIPTAKVSVPVQPKTVSKPDAKPSVIKAHAKPLTVAQPRLPKINMGLPGESSSQRYRPLLVKRKKRSGTRRWVLRGFSIALILVIVTASLLFSQGYMKIHKVFKGTAAPIAALEPNVNPESLKGEGDGRVNVLLLGRGGGDHDGPDLTDTMMLASIDPVNHTATLLSIPRDLWVDVPNDGAMKINAAWENGEFNYLRKIAPGSTNPNAIQSGFSLADQTVESVLGVTVDYNVIMDFSAFQQAVSTVGGVTINVPTELYDPTMAWQNNNNPILAEAGIQNFTGSQALNYVRSRETTSDFARAQRQRAVLVAIEQKAVSLGTISDPLKMSSLLSAFSNNVASDLSIKDGSDLYKIVKGISSSNVSSIGLADAPNNYVTTSNIDGQSVDEPTAGLFDYSDIQQYVREQLKDPYILKEDAKVLVLNGTDQSGLAASEATALENYGYNIIGTADAPTDNYQQTTVVDLSKGKDPYTKHYLEQRFNTTAVTTLRNSSIQTHGAKFVIIVGSDETTTN